MSKTILIATEKPFAGEAIDKIRKKIENAGGYHLELLEAYSDKSALLKAVENVDALIVRSDKVTAEVIDASKNLKIIVRAGSGFDNIDLDKASEKGIVVMNTPGQNANAVAELAFGMMLGLIRNKYDGTPGTELQYKRIGMHGYGNIGKCMAIIAKGFSMKTYAYDLYLSKAVVEQDGVNYCKSAEELYSTCDFISINIPANEETIKCIDYKLLSKTKEGVLLINTARKELIDEAGLLKWMEESPRFLYVSDIKPDCVDEINSKYGKRTLFTTNKMGAQTAEANINAGVASVTQIIRFFKDDDRTFQVNG